MNEIGIYVGGLVITVILSLTIILYLKKSFRKLLIDLTETQERANFWLTFSNILLILIPLVFSMSIVPGATEEIDVFFEVGRQLKWALIGLISSMVVIGFVMISFVFKK